MIRFLHTADWQLGMTRHFFGEGAQERYSQARFDAIRTMGRIACQEQCRFVLVCGDAFESNQVDRKTVARALEALREIGKPVFILPGNHDPLHAASVYRSGVFQERKPPNVTVIEDCRAIPVDGDVTLVGAPWLSKRPVGNPVEEALALLDNVEDGRVRICLAHGPVDTFAAGSEPAGLVSVALLEQAIAGGKIHYAALGDRHSLTPVGGSGRIWYSGSPEPTDFREVQSGFVQLVELEENQIQTRSLRVGQWLFLERERVDLNTAADVEALRQWLDGIDSKERAVIRLNLVGSLTLSLRDALQQCLAAAGDVLGALDARSEELLVLPEDADFAGLGFTGFADAVVQRLRARTAENGKEAATAREALLLLLRLARGAL